MQPYLFPYIGYFQLMAAVDRWVVYDDVTYIKRGWINRNNLKVNGQRCLFTVPVAGASQFQRICDVKLDAEGYDRWRVRFRRTLQQSYGHAPHFAEAFGLVDDVLSPGAQTIAELNLRGLLAVRAYVGLGAEIVPTSRRYGNQDLRGQNRILDICRREGADTYINAIGGTELYDGRTLSAQGVTLRFLEPDAVAYPQGGGGFVPHLSVIDAMMHNDRAKVRSLIQSYRLVDGVSA